MKLNWKYCECGCHQHEATAGPLSFSIFTYNPYKSDPTPRNHRLAAPSHSNNWEHFDTWKEAAEAAVGKVKRALKEIEADLR